ncbi:uncharacterized protein GJ701_016665 [Geothlypis trichas]
MDILNVLCSLIIFLQIAFLPRGSTYNFSLCNHGKIQEDLLNVLDPEKTFTQEELRLDFHTCEDAPSEPAGKQLSEDSRRAERAGRLLECLLERARGCGERPELWRLTRSVLKHHCPGFSAPQQGRTGTARRVSPGDSAGSAAGTSSPVPCDKSKARELVAVWRSYNNLG